MLHKYCHEKAYQYAQNMIKTNKIHNTSQVYDELYNLEYINTYDTLYSDIKKMNDFVMVPFPPELDESKEKAVILVCEYLSNNKSCTHTKKHEINHGELLKALKMGPNGNSDVCHDIMKELKKCIDAKNAQKIDLYLNKYFNHLNYLNHLDYHQSDQK